MAESQLRLKTAASGSGFATTGGTRITALSRYGTATLTIEHQGTRKDVTLNVAQVAEQASHDLSIDPNNMPAADQAAPLPSPPADDSNN